MQLARQIEAGEVILMSDIVNELTVIRNKMDKVQSAEAERQPGKPHTADPGGIDMNPKNIDMQKSGPGFKIQFPEFIPEFPLNLIEGLVPVIINVVPVTNIPFILGISQEGQKGQELAGRFNPKIPYGKWPEFGYRADPACPLDTKRLVLVS
jgi:hypothetical protein